MINLSKIQLNMSKVAITVIATIIILFLTFNFGYKSGSNNVQVKWDKAVEVGRKQIDDMRSEKVKLETQHKAKTETINDELIANQAKYEASIAAIHAADDDRMRQANSRVEHYRSLSETGEADIRVFANRLSELDIALTAGVALVDELSKTIEQRDDTIRSWRAQLIADRELFANFEKESREINGKK